MKQKFLTFSRSNVGAGLIWGGPDVGQARCGVGLMLSMSVAGI